MSLLRKGLSCLCLALDRVASAWQRVGNRASTRRPRCRLDLESLEARQLLAANMAVGMNIERVTDYATDRMFTDAFKASRPWQPSVYNTVTHTVTPDTTGLMPVSLDPHGWPTQLNQTTNIQGQLLRQELTTLMFFHVNGHYPAGTYTAQWDGAGTLQWGGDVRVTQTGMTPDGHHYALLGDPTPGDQGIQMRIASMSSADPIRNIHVWLPDYNGQSFVGQVWHPGATFSPFHPLFLQRLSPFTTLRFMQDSETITSGVQHWSDRRPWDYATQMSGTGFQNGIAPEYLIELSNELNANAWINIPHMADDDYVRNLATQVRDTLKPGRKVYLEWSNEVWNRAPGFLPYQWITQQLALPQNAGVTFEQFVAREDRRVFDIWSQVFADQTNRLVRVVAGFEQNPSYTARLLQNMGGDFDAVSCAAYFGPSDATRATYSAGTTVDQIVNDTRASIPTALGFLTSHKRLADHYTASLGRPISLVAYEGGPALEGHNQPYQAAMNAASIDPRTYDVYRTFLQGANQAGLSLLVNYEYTDRNISASPYGIYGALNYQDQPITDAPKYHALLDAASGTLFASQAAPLPSVTRAAVTLAPAQRLPVLLVIANQDFYYREYSDTRQALEQAGFQVRVAAGMRSVCRPHANSGQGADGGLVMPDLAVTDAQAVGYSAVVLVGGWGASEYQYAFQGTYANAAYNGTTAIRNAVNQLINDFGREGKYITAICHGVSVLAWARVNGSSPLAGHHVAAYEGSSPAFRLGGVSYPNQPDHWHEDVNGATVFAPRSLGDPTTAADDVWVDGKIITAENFDSARRFGQVLAQELSC
jgi:putative intracellular protease/amidase